NTSSTELAASILSQSQWYSFSAMMCSTTASTNSFLSEKYWYRVFLLAPNPFAISSMLTLRTPHFINISDAFERILPLVSFSIVIILGRQNYGNYLCNQSFLSIFFTVHNFLIWRRYIPLK